MKILFRLSLVVFASLFYGCMSDPDQNNSLTIVLPDLSNLTFVNEFVPAGNVYVIKSVQFNSGKLIVASSKELSKLYLYVYGEQGYYTLPLTIKDKTNSAPDNYVYSVLLMSLPYKSDNIYVSSKTTEEDISHGIEVSYLD